jgi:hypothetical protein
MVCGRRARRSITSSTRCSSMGRTSRVGRPRGCLGFGTEAPSTPPNDLLIILGSSVAVLRVVLDALGEGERSFYPSGMADRSGWIAMACGEMLVHTADVSMVLDVDLPGTPDALIHEVVDRVLPWAPEDPSAWGRLLWATGRTALGELAPVSPDWWWHPAPLNEWDGHPRRRPVDSGR